MCKRRELFCFLTRRLATTFRWVTFLSITTCDYTLTPYILRPRSLMGAYNHISVFSIYIAFSFIILFGSANNGVFKQSEGQPSFDLLGFWISVFSHYKWSVILEMQAESLYKVSFNYEDKRWQHSTTTNRTLSWFLSLKSRSQHCQKQNEARHESN